MMTTCRQHALQTMLALFILALPTYSQSIVTTYTPYQALPTTPIALIGNNGAFTWPLTGSVELYEIGSIMNISWTAKFSKTSLLLVPNFDWSASIPLIIDTYSTNHEWTVQCLGDCEVPWLVRAVDAEGDGENQFLSAEFWIMPAEDNNSTTTSANFRMTTTTVIKSTVTVSPQRVTVRLNGTTSATSSTNPATTTTFRIPAGTTRAPASTPATSSETSPSSTQSGSAVLRNYIDAGVKAVVMIAVVFCWWL